MRRGPHALAGGLLRGCLAIVSAVLLVAHLVLFVPGLGLGLVFLLPWPMAMMRRVTDAARRACGDLPRPYRDRPAPPEPEPDGRFRHDRVLYRSAFWPRQLGYLNWVLGDPATWRDVGWMLTNPVVGGVLGFGPAALVVGGLAVATGAGPWWIPVGLAMVVLGVLVAPAAVRAHDSWTRRLLGPPQPTFRSVKVWLGERFVTLAKLLALGGLTVVSVALAGISVLALALFCVGIVGALPEFATVTRQFTATRRRLAEQWSGVPIQTPYRPEPPLPQRRPDGLYEVGDQLYKSKGWTRFFQRIDWVWHDPATWRDLLWTATDPIVGGALVAASVGAVAYGLAELTVPALVRLARVEDPPRLAFLADRPVLALLAGLSMVVAGALFAPTALRLHGRWTAVLLAPTAKARLASRVEQLTVSRDDATSAQAAELRRIERDLHDGAQGRLVAVGLALGAVEALIDTDPAAARRLVADARESTARALAELRDLVRGVRPPVLAERGLVEAVRALALDSPVPVTVSTDLVGRPAEPVEAAVYFVVSEALVNTAKHAAATQVSIVFGYADGLLTTRIADDGRGGADPALGSGLRGMRHRLAAFDGTVRLVSPVGGPTTVTLEVPCALSSPRTSTSSGKGSSSC
ncbi:Signal transduction histidine kinase [Asanoa hainanensis]|uniref:histidine kinase n=1 Tax=Asanoa hainanensis TaxID=560556 RepID=A0A239K4S9_9ACTN|nr:sensor histidine kinase [Asanoa hainanensis]SNT13347.1 Signal transduction histidine kinase [Asanoa hainanensis]